MTSGTVRPEVDVYRPDGSILTYGIANTTGPGAGTYFSTAANVAGTYYVIVKDYYAANPGNYSLTLANVPSTQAADPNGGALTTSVTRSSNITGNLHLFTISAKAGGLSASIGTTSGTLRPEIDLYDPTGKLVTYAVAGGSGTGSGTNFTTTVATAGTYYLIAHDYYGTGAGNFNITATFTTLPPPPPPGSIAGTVFNDLNKNGKIDTGEAGFGGWKVYIDANNNGVFDAGDTYVLTDKYGNFKFSGLNAGTYNIRETIPTGYAATIPVNGLLTVKLTSAQTLTGLLFGDINVGPGAIAGTIFNDTNGDGTRESTEAGLAGWTVYIDANHNGVFDSTELIARTDANGNFSFSGLAAGSYIVRAFPNSGWTLTGTGASGFTLIVSSGKTTTGANFGFKQ